MLLVQTLCLISETVFTGERQTDGSESMFGAGDKPKRLKGRMEGRRRRSTSEATPEVETQRVEAAEQMAPSAVCNLQTPPDDTRGENGRDIP